MTDLLLKASRQLKNLVKDPTVTISSEAVMVRGTVSLFRRVSVGIMRNLLFVLITLAMRLMTRLLRRTWNRGRFVRRLVDIDCWLWTTVIVAMVTTMENVVNSIVFGSSRLIRLLTKVFITLVELKTRFACYRI